MKRRFFALLLVLSMVLSMLPSPAAAAAPEAEHTHTPQTDIPAQEQTDPAEESAAETSAPVSGQIHGTQTNPLYSNGTVQGRVDGARLYSSSLPDINDYITESEEVTAIIYNAMLQRQSSVTVQWYVRAATPQSLEEKILKAFVMALGHTGTPDGGDYLLHSYSEMAYGGEYIKNGGEYYLTMTYAFTYYTTAQQEAAVAAKLEEVMASFGFTAATDDYTKIKTIYDYICANVVYDYANLEDAAYTLKFTAYAALINGTAVCQGYATLLYRMLLMAGIDNRVIFGDHEGVGHAWNIVALDNFYYNVDSTWDSGYTEYNYFLKCPANFPEHTRDAEFDTATFHTYYPMAPMDYVPGENPVIASGTCGEGVNWVLMSDGILTVSGAGAMDDYASASAAPWYGYRDYVVGVVVEPGVTRVGKRAFYGYPQLQAVSCAATTIGEYAFSENKALLAVDLLEGAEEVGKSAFSYCKNMVAVSVPTSMRRFDERAFESCGALQAVFITDLAAWCGIEFISSTNYGYNHYTSNPLSGNADLYLNETLVTELVIPENVTSISAGAFSQSNLTSVIMHDNVTEVESYAFFQTHLTELKLSAGLETIRPHTFSDFELDTLVIPEGVKRIENTAFAGASNSIKTITAVHFPSTLEYIGSNNLEATQIHLTDLAAWCNMEFGNDRTPAYHGADFYLNGELITDLVIPDGVTEIKPYTFMGSSIRSLTLPDSVVSIGDHAFRWSQGKASQLSRVIWSKNLQSIGASAFANCALQELVLPDSVQVLGKSAFFQNSSLSSIHIGTGLTKLGDSVFGQTAITDLTLPSHVIELGSRTFAGCEKLTRLDLGTSLTTIGGGAFTACTALTEVVIPDQVTSIGKGVFTSCESLTSVRMGSGLTVIPESAFSGCGKLTSFTIGKNVEVIEKRAFERCSKLKTLVMSPVLKSVDTQIFYDTRLGTIIFTGDVPTFTGATQNTALCSTVKYPCTNPTWTEGFINNYSRYASYWLPNHICENGICTLCGAKEIIMYGSSGAKWILEADGTLTVYGSGYMQHSPIPAPQEYLVKTLIIGENVTGIYSHVLYFAYENLEAIIFQGDAPTFGDSAFHELTTTAYYPGNNPTWTEDVLKDYGGNITWVAACTNGHTEVPVPGYGATCTEPGLTDGSKCSFCGVTLVEREPIEATGHTEVPVIGYGPTCTEPGLTDGTKCSVCDEPIVAQQPIEAPGHTEVPVIGYGATCTEPGLTDGTKCTTCGEMVVEQQPIEAPGHTEVPVIGYGATCTEPGLTDGTKCTTCGEMVVEQQPIESPGHTEVPVIGYGPTCTEPGLTDGTKCSVCDEPIVAQQPIESPGHTEVPVIGYGPTCTEPGLTDGTKCSVCDEPIVAQEPIEATGHTEVPVTGYGATCTQPGLTDGTKCSVCDEPIIAQEPSPMDPHDFVDGTCTVCGAPEVYYLLGDVNLDGSVDSMDTNILFRYANEDPTLGELTEVQLQVADANGDGFVDSMDTNILFRYANEDAALVWSPTVIVPRRVTL